MFEYIKIRNLRRFHNVEIKELTKIVILFGNNGSGKTTFARIFYYLKKGNSKDLISKLKNKKDETCYILKEGKSSNYKVLIHNNWENFIKNPGRIFEFYEVFTKDFVDEYIYVGTRIEQEHKENLFQFIVGKEQVDLKRNIEAILNEEKELDKKIKEIELKFKEIGIDKSKLKRKYKKKNKEEIEKLLKEKEKKLESLKKRNELLKKPEFVKIEDKQLTELIGQVKNIISLDIENIHQEALELKRKHFEKFKNLDKNWFEEGIEYIKKENKKKCPLCENSLENSEFIKILVKGISEEIEKLIKNIENIKNEIAKLQLSEIWEVDKKNKDLYIDWKNYIENLPQIYKIEPKHLENIFDSLKEHLINILNEKKINLTIKYNNIDENLIEGFIQIVKNYNETVDKLNNVINKFKEELEKDKKNLENLKEEISNLRYELKIIDNEELVNSYNSLKKQKRNKGNKRKSLQDELNEKVNKSLEKYKDIINDCLDNFYADFKIEKVKPEKTTGKGKKGKQKIEYGIKILDEEIKLEDDFNYSLSEGDKTTLAFAFFIAKILKNSEEENKKLIVLIDDPISSLDRHRLEKTVEYILKISEKVKQCFILTHNEIFFEKLFEKVKEKKKLEVKYFKIDKKPQNSELKPLDPVQFLEESKNYLKALRALNEYYYEGKDYGKGELRKYIRIALEYYIRRKYYPDFEKELTLGHMIRKAKAKADKEKYKKRYKFILDNEEILNELNEFSSDDHHANDIISDDNTLNNFVKKTLEVLEG